MANFAYVQDSAIVEVHDNLPANWKNHSNFFALAGETDYLKSLGWYPVVYQAPEYDDTTKKLGQLTYTFDGTQVVESNELIDKPVMYTPPAKTEEELLAEAWVAVRKQRDLLMAEADWRYNRYARQVRLELTPTDDITLLDAYMQALADVTAQEDPYNITRPTL